MNNTSAEWRAGDWVEVRSPGEISRTLDASGTLDGLPFMPEMLACCGRRYRLLRKAEKTCVEIPGGIYAIREFRHNDVMLLEGQRCSGAAHDGCQRLCMFFWRAAWLRKVDSGDFSEIPDVEESQNLRAALITKSATGKYFCQSTELSQITKSEPMTPSRILLNCYRDVQSGAVSALDMILLVLVPLYRKVRDRLFGRPLLFGNLTRTPTGTLELQPGEIVEIRSQKEMQATLDHRGRNRGLVCDIELKKFCGLKYQVLSRLDKMISEPTGEMREVKGTVILKGNTCMCARALGGCPRLEFCYWREVWLKRVEPAGQIHE
jgi:hypothetical protein